MPYSAKQVFALQTERTDDPLVRGYSGMTDTQFHTSITAVDRNRNRASMSRTEILNSVDPVEYAALAGDDLTALWGLLSVESLDPFGVEADVMQDIFGAGNTIIALALARIETISRVNEIGLPDPILADVGRTT